MPQIPDWPGQAPLSPSKRRIVYTCMFGFSERFADRQVEDDSQTDFFCFTDDRTLTSQRWQFRYLDSTQLGPVRTSKMLKHLAHRFFSGYSESLYFDNTVRLKTTVDRIFALLPGSASPMMCFKHPDRDCIYDEADVVMALGADDPKVVKRQVMAYRVMLHPRHAGLATTPVILRRHNDPALIPVAEAWFQELLRHSYRDQISFNFVAHRARFSPAYFEGTIWDNPIIEWPVFEGHRIPRGFRDDLYVQLYPDVLASGMTPREHYLKVGADQGRRWD